MKWWACAISHTTCGGRGIRRPDGCSRIFSRLVVDLSQSVELLINIEPAHWETLLEDEVFLSMYKSVLREFETYMKTVSDAWFAKNHPGYQGGPFVYFSTEFGFHECLRTYSGGLGVLPGDHCKSASNLGIPFIAIGPLYKHGYFEQEVEPDGRQQHFYPAYDFSRLPIRPLLGDNGRHLTVNIDFPDRTVYARVWLAQVGRVPVLLLDTDTNKNQAADRPITGQLYVSGREMRICQEIVIGVGGCGRCRRWASSPPVAYERRPLRVPGPGTHPQFVKAGANFADACKEVAKNSIFTTHTPVPAGNEAFDVGLVRKYYKNYCKDIGISLDQLIDLGLSNPGQGNQPFSLTVLAIHLSTFCNGVSQLHGKVSNDMGGMCSRI